jgi:hypothetical protein
MENCQVGCLVLQDRRVCPDSTHNKTDSRTEPAALNPSNSGFAGLDLSGSATQEREISLRPHRKTRTCL